VWVEKQDENGALHLEGNGLHTPRHITTAQAKLVMN
jgi:hypothetical protein